MGRKKQWTERLQLTLPSGAKERIDSVLVEGEDRNAMVRQAIETEIRKRTKRSTKANAVRIRDGE
ncbi:hypothetical protein [Asaia spathodeae]|uniref:Arc-like DNA binding domain-containing protein n=1 Tax=Asaia spathodeae TaxID=657016 RepID=A0ABX2P9K4_9PROT|nr:hypothetical protein [Asaia spathodeae]GBR16788.1 hypothetical protein AA105894_1659 [Asaia spathodeae NBRC 105894]